MSRMSRKFICFKTLFHIFEDYLEEQKRARLLNERTGFFDSEIWDTLYDFQKDGVKGAINKILSIMAVLSPTASALSRHSKPFAVIKYFELLNSRVLVLCPKRKLSGNWIYQASQNHAANPFKRTGSITVLYPLDMARESGHSDANRIDEISIGARRMKQGRY